MQGVGLRISLCSVADSDDCFAEHVAAGPFWSLAGLGLPHWGVSSARLLCIQLEFMRDAYYNYATHIRTRTHTHTYDCRRLLAFLQAAKPVAIICIELTD